MSQNTIVLIQQVAKELELSHTELISSVKAPEKRSEIISPKSSFSLNSFSCIKFKIACVAGVSVGFSALEIFGCTRNGVRAPLFCSHSIKSPRRRLLRRLTLVRESGKLTIVTIFPPGIRLTTGKEINPV